MESLKNIILLALVVLLIITGLFGYTAYNLYKTEKLEKERQEQNVLALQTETDTLRTKYNEFTSTNLSLKQTIQEIKNSENRYLIDQIKNMKIEVKNVNSISEQSMQVSHKDSIKLTPIVYRDTNTNTFKEIKTANYKDKWFNNQYTYYSDGTLVSNYNYSDSALLIIHNYKIGKFKFMNIFVKRKIGQKASIKLGCPYSKIFVKQIEIYKK